MTPDEYDFLMELHESSSDGRMRDVADGIALFYTKLFFVTIAILSVGFCVMAGAYR